MTVDAGRAGRVLGALGLGLAALAAAGEPDRGCIAAVGRDTGPSISFGLDAVTYELFGRACFVDTLFLVGVAGVMLAIVGALCWVAAAAGLFTRGPRDVR